jgi:hypothetical protein
MFGCSTIWLIGVPIPHDQVRPLAGQVEDDTLTVKLLVAIDRETRVLALSPTEREILLLALDDPGPELAELRGAILRARAA